MFTITTMAVSGMMMPLGGLDSFYFSGVMLVIMARVAFVAERWREGVLPNGLMVGGHVATLFGGVLWMPAMRVQLGEPEVLARFGIQLAFLLCTATFGIIAANTAWTRRRQVFEARNIGKYRLVRCIGHGGMGEVWRAYHPGLKREVAVKLLRPDRDPSLTQRFEREVQATIRLSHPNTIRVFDYGVTDDGISYYVMELLEGCTVRELVANEGPLDPARVLYLALQAAGALAEAHDLGIVHRDVKPENIFVTAVGRTGDFVKILDFGIAKAINVSDETALTRTGVRLGTLGYIVPEVLAGGDADASADVYALGAVLHFMLAGTPPFGGDDERSVLLAQLQGKPTSIVGARGLGSIPSSLETAVQRCLSRDPAARFADAAVLLAWLHRCDDVGTWHPGPPRLFEAANPLVAHGATAPDYADHAGRSKA